MPLFENQRNNRATIPVIMRPYSPSLLLHSWESVYSCLESIIFKTGLFSHPKLPNVPMMAAKQSLHLVIN